MFTGTAEQSKMEQHSGHCSYVGAPFRECTIQSGRGNRDSPEHDCRPIIPSLVQLAALL